MSWLNCAACGPIYAGVGLVVGPTANWVCRNKSCRPALFSTRSDVIGDSIMHKFVVGIAGSVTVACLLSGAGPALGGLHNPPAGWTFSFAQAQSIGGNTAVTAKS